MVTLWSFCLLSSLAVIMSQGVRQKKMLAQRLEDQDKLHLIAEAGVKAAVTELKKENLKSFDYFGDLWSNNITAFKDVNIGDGKFNVCYSQPDSSGTPETCWGLVDEERKINLNTAEMQVLRRLSRVVLGFNETQAQEFAASIVDWRDPDSELSIPLGSAEDTYYEDLKYPYAAKDADFEVLDELLLVKGIDKDIFQKIKDYLTVYGSGKININTASKEVLLALGLDEAIVRKILLSRAGQDGAEGTGDDNIFDSVTNIIPKLSRVNRLSDAELAQLSQVQDEFTTSSSIFTIRSVAKLNQKKNTIEATCVVDRNGRVLYYREI